jgi:hypothetical protein
VASQLGAHSGDDPLDVLDALTVADLDAATILREGPVRAALDGEISRAALADVTRRWTY